MFEKGKEISQRSEKEVKKTEKMLNDRRNGSEIEGFNIVMENPMTEQMACDMIEMFKEHSFKKELVPNQGIEEEFEGGQTGVYSIREYYTQSNSLAGDAYAYFGYFDDAEMILFIRLETKINPISSESDNEKIQRQVVNIIKDVGEATLT